MYSRDFGGIKSEGQLYNMEQEYNSRIREELPPVHTEECPPQKENRKGFGLNFLRDLQIDDLILIAIGILLLLDSDEDNDIFLLIVAFLLFF